MLACCGLKKHFRGGCCFFVLFCSELNNSRQDNGVVLGMCAFGSSDVPLITVAHSSTMVGIRRSTVGLNATNQKEITENGGGVTIRSLLVELGSEPLSGSDYPIS